MLVEFSIKLPNPSRSNEEQVVISSLHHRSFHSPYITWLYLDKQFQCWYILLRSRLSLYPAIYPKSLNFRCNIEELFTNFLQSNINSRYWTRHQRLRYCQVLRSLTWSSRLFSNNPWLWHNHHRTYFWT